MSNQLSVWIQSHPPDWKKLPGMLQAHGIRPVVFDVVSKHPEGIPPQFFDRLKQQCMKITTENMGRLRELVRISEHFQNRAISVVPYKGLILSQTIYGNYSSRECADIDLLVLPEEFPTIKNDLHYQGYENRMYYNEGYEDYVINTDREHKLYKDIDGIRMNIELQWKPLHDLMGVPLQNRHLFQNLYKIEVLGREIMVLSPESRMLLMSAHHGVADVWRKLKHVMDIAMLLKKYSGHINWEHFERVLKRNGILKFSTAGYVLAQEVLGVANPIHNKLSHAETKKMTGILLSYPLLSTEKKDLKHLSVHLMLLDCKRDRLAFLKRYFVLWLRPNMRDFERVSLPKQFFPLYYIIRRFRFLRGSPAKK